MPDLKFKSRLDSKFTLVSLAVLKSMKWDSRGVRVLTRGQGGLKLSCGCHHGHASHCFTKHAASGHTQSGIWALFHCTVHNAWFDRKFTHKYSLVCLIWGLGSVSVLHAQMARTLISGASLVAAIMATPPTVFQNTLPAATHNLEFEHCSTDSNSSLFEHFLAHHIVSTLLWFEKHYFAEKISKALTKYERLKMKRDACQKCCLFLTAFLAVCVSLRL